MIRFENVTKRYQGGQPAVDALTMSIDKGAITVFVGPSGCGKTTSLRMINRMVEPTSGTITVDGQDVTAVPAAKLRRSMGYVMQSSGLMPHRSVLDNIATVPRLNGVSKADARYPEQIRYIDVRPRFAEHGLCAPDSWMIGPLITNPSVSYHPNAAGQRNGYLAALRAVTG